MAATTEVLNQSPVTSHQDHYRELVFGIRRLAAQALPREATVLVVNKGDSELLNLAGRKAWHFPCTSHGDYDWHYPADSTAAIEHLEQLRDRGADYILFPATAFWWLDFYADFRRHLEDRYAVTQDDATCLIFSLRPLTPATTSSSPDSAVLNGTVKRAVDHLAGSDQCLEDIKSYCARIQHESVVEASLTSRFLEHLKEHERWRHFPSDIQLEVAKSLSAAGQKDPVAECLDLTAIFTHAGNRFAAEQDYFKAEACYELAVAGDTRDWNSQSLAARFNLAFNQMSLGNPAAAGPYLSGVTRVSPDKSAAILWPEQAGRAWPHSRFDLSAAFEKLKPVGLAWPSITVITPSFNQAAYVEETLVSVLNQNYPALEYIVVDGESTDGTIDILKGYEPRLSKLIVEPDEGQADAINKGLRLATGEIILWLNSDDLLGPGALFQIGLEFLKSKADIIYGFCCEHTDRRFGVINLPPVTPATFNLECLGDIFNYWLKGHYFYQPEVAFSRSILEKAGGSLSAELNYTMDYDFWMRCAQAGAQLAAIQWPVGFFRKHDKQKTSSLDKAIIEQAQVRDRFVVCEPGIERRLQIRERISRAFSQPVTEVSVVSMRAQEIFSPDTARELSEQTFAPGLRVTFHSEIESIKAGSSDLVIVLMHLRKEHEKLRKLREGGYEGPIIGWFWEDHHRVFENYRAAADLDVCIPGHGSAESYLRSMQYLLQPSLPPCVTRWTGDEAHRFFEKYGQQERSNALYVGGCGKLTGKQKALVEQLAADAQAENYFRGESTPDHLGLPAEERFKHWAGYKTSLCLSEQLSERFFNALIAGQIPIVGDERDLDQVISRELQAALPIVRLSDYTTAAIAEGHANAVQRFDRDGEAGAVRRHEFALKNHMFHSRVRAIVSALESLTSDCEI